MTTSMEFDQTAYERIIEHVIRGKVHGIFIMGTNGEGASLSDVVRKRAIQTAVKSVSGRLPLFVNASTASFIESQELCRLAADEGADFVVLSPPFYFDMSQEELYRYFDKLASNSSLPVFLYNAPRYTKTKIDSDTAFRLSEHPNIWGLKDSSGDMVYMKRLLEDREDPDFKILVGTELLLRECILLGADGGINGGANVFPELYVKMYHASVNRDLELQERLQSMMKGMASQVYSLSDSPVSIIIGLKYALSVLGVCSSHLAMPVYASLSSLQKKTVENYIKKMIASGLTEP
jgi:4-hydroxy-tetrahydrodipicolinate synthase